MTVLYWGERPCCPRSIAARLNGFTMLLRRDMIIIAISTLIGIALAYGVHSLP
jgi:hypothetical protein